VELVERLFGKGYDIRIFDNNVCVERLTGTNWSFVQSRIPHLTSLLSTDARAVAQHGDTLIIAHADQAIRSMLTPLRDDQRVIDLGAFSAEEAPVSGCYSGICW
jgi:GDP-mannose 6-dehydrogenase